MNQPYLYTVYDDVHHSIPELYHDLESRVGELEMKKIKNDNGFNLMSNG